MWYYRSIPVYHVRTMMQKLLVPIAILGSAVILFGAVFLLRSGSSRSASGNLHPELIQDVSASDHVLGSPDAPVKVVEYSDIDCPFCKIFEETMKKVQADYGSDKVAWVFRHLPLVSNHKDAEHHAEAAECVASQKGSQAFFDFISAIHVMAPEDQKFDPANYGKLLPAIGVDEAKFNDCRAKGTFAQRVADESNEAQEAGATGTPFIVIIPPQGAPRAAFTGALSYEQMKQIVDAGLATPTSK